MNSSSSSTKSSSNNVVSSSSSGSSMNTENDSRVFHLQLTISKLQEELRLYRNGTTAEQFLEIIAEKDMQIDMLTKDMHNMHDNMAKMVKIVKGLRDAVGDKEDLAQHNITLQRDIDRLMQENGMMKQKINSYSSSGSSSSSSSSSSNGGGGGGDSSSGSDEEENTSNDKVLIIQRYEQELAEHYQSIEKLQVRCASLVCEKSKLSKALEKERNERIKEVAEYKDELNRAIYYNNELKERLTNEHSDNIALTTELRNIKRKMYESHKMDSIENKENLKNSLSNHTNSFIL